MIEIINKLRNCKLEPNASIDKLIYEIITYYKQQLALFNKEIFIFNESNKEILFDFKFILSDLNILKFCMCQIFIQENGKSNLFSFKTFHI